MKPQPRLDFCIIGAMKSGTTTVAEILNAHPHLHIPVKEPHYFSRHWNKQPVRDYLSAFQPEAGQLCGDASTSYTFAPEYPGTAERLFAHNPQMRLIYVVRNPVDRIVSHLSHAARRTGRVMDDPFALPSFLNRSRYAYQLDHYLKCFPPEQVLVLAFEECIAGGALSRVIEFLDVPPSTNPVVPRLNSRDDSVQRVRGGWRRLLSCLPAPWQATLTPLFSRQRIVPPDQPKDLPAGIRERLWDVLREDVQRLATFAPDVVRRWAHTDPMCAAIVPDSGATRRVAG